MLTGRGSLVQDCSRHILDIDEQVLVTTICTPAWTISCVTTKMFLSMDLIMILLNTGTARSLQHIAMMQATKFCLQQDIICCLPHVLIYCKMPGIPCAT